jgi:hypothetical protein
MGGDPTHVGCLMTLSMTDLCFSNSLIPVTTSLSMGWGVLWGWRACLGPGFYSQNLKQTKP